MRRMVLALVKKEFIQIRRDPIMLRLIFIMPLIQLILLGYAVNTDVKNIRTAVYDFDQTSMSRDFIRSFTAGDYFRLESPGNIPVLELKRGFTTNRYDAALIIPEDFSEELTSGRSVSTGFVVDGSNANSAAVGLGYAAVITGRYNQQKSPFKSPISMRQRILYNPEGESVYFMVPGIVALLLTMVTSMLTSMAIVREREVGTLEQLMVTPISTRALILGKTIPFAVLGYIELSVALAFGILWFGIPFAGSWVLLYVLSFIFLLTPLGVGMFISTVTKTQQQAMFFTWFFTIYAILTSGFFTPISNMPEAVQYITYLNPLRYFMVIVRGIMMKGSGVIVLYPEIIAVVIFGLVIFTMSWMRFSKRVK